ncbi:MAG TPA: hypothetical protein VFH63_07825 [candidate division Zixibacteria bacterium]|nr:hypothetical protein [candidate division Zixibacteria bacterium]
MNTAIPLAEAGFFPPLPRIPRRPERRADERGTGVAGRLRRLLPRRADDPATR